MGPFPLRIRFFPFSVAGNDATVTVNPVADGRSCRAPRPVFAAGVFPPLPPLTIRHSEAAAEEGAERLPRANTQQVEVTGFGTGAPRARPPAVIGRESAGATGVGTAAAADAQGVSRYPGGSPEFAV